MLDAQERSSARRFLRAEDRRDYIAAHALLRRTLSGMTPGVEPLMWHFDRTVRGKPFVSAAVAGAGSLPFSLSHTRGLVACAAGRAGNLGIDVERDAAFDVDALSEIACSSWERAQLETKSGPGRTNAFLDLWTLKEAYWKARGLGIDEDLATVSFDLRTDGSTITTTLPSHDPLDWFFVLLRPTPDSRIALALAQDVPGSLQLDAARVEQDGTLTPLWPALSGGVAALR